MRNIKELTHENWWKMREVKDLPSGGAYSYIETGNPKKDVLILLHGFGNSSRVWKMCMESLADDYHIVAVDLRGVGFSKGSEMFAYPIADQAKDVLELMDALEIDRAYVAGHSIGSSIAQAMAMQAPKRIIKEILIASSVNMDLDPEDIIRIGNHSDNHYPEADKYPDKQAFYYLLVDREKLPKQYFTSTMFGLIMTDHKCFLQFITCPLLLIWGSNDIITEERRRALRKALPDAKTIIYEGVGHEVPSREPIKLAEDIKLFCQ